MHISFKTNKNFFLLFFDSEFLKKKFSLANMIQYKLCCFKIRGKPKVLKQKLVKVETNYFGNTCFDFNSSN